MTEDGILNPVKILDKISVNESQTSRSTLGEVEPITPTIIIVIGLRYCASELMKSLSDIYVTSCTHTALCINIFWAWLLIFLTIQC